MFLHHVSYGEQRGYIWVPKGSVNSALGSDSVTSGGEQLCDTRSIKPCLGKTKCGTQTSTPSTDNNCIIFVVYHRIIARYMRLETRKRSSMHGHKQRLPLHGGAMEVSDQVMRAGGCYLGGDDSTGN
jgi:hypothetical protein